MNFGDVKRIIADAFRAEDDGSYQPRDLGAEINDYRAQVLENRNWPDEKLKLVEHVIAKMESCSSTMDTLRNIESAKKAGITPEEHHKNQLADFVERSPEFEAQLEDHDISLQDVYDISRGFSDHTTYAQHCIAEVANWEPKEALVCH